MARHTSLESERPIMAQSARTSKRFSTVSEAPTVASSETTFAGLPAGDPRLADFHNLRDGLERLENKPLLKQRFVPTPEKTDNLSKLALGAKVERALGRRMTSQDAVMREPVLNEKAAVEAPRCIRYGSKTAIGRGSSIIANERPGLGGLNPPHADIMDGKWTSLPHCSTASSTQDPTAISFTDSNIATTAATHILSLIAVVQSIDEMRP
ncbi:uncharacterized protein BO96DRAFT_327848 [Aspergillus niger CBS 101883]|uniref:Contig An09c0220, genomic contig n=10 Tax=Aspergillus TaxID=5052 RepID=A2QUS0_ASPNC|nr:uncharacterized protein BO96DRAFT_327848 [Aspergillus niger CBS 101883]XP_059601476.1 uncharacterized protein An09g06570 [Aspergillus niger]PYH60745.1 hypothetical protein BO96DRAFT_327848 [Aspergillus niger CBS 101883]CAK40450.1 unnamed protein product [Aspergillus niger]